MFSLTPLILFFGLTVATAVIAYWSDNLGKKLGKKRVSLFGLRPRTTATILTITSSWGIMVFTLLVLLGVVAPLRHALFRYDHDISEAKKSLLDEQQRLAGTRQRLSGAEEKLSTATKKLSSYADDLQKANTNIQTARSQASSATEKAKAAQSRASAAQGREALARRGELQAEKLKSNAQSELQASKLSLSQVEAKFNETQNRLSEAKGRLASTNVRLDEVQDKLRMASVSLRNASGNYRDLGRTYLSLGRESDRLQRQRDYLEKQVADLARSARTYMVTVSQLAGGDVKIPVGRVFADGIIQAGQGSEAVETALHEIFDQGEKTFEERDETKSLFNRGYRLQLLPRTDIVGGESVTLEGEQLYRRYAQDILAQGGAASVRMVAAVNFADEKMDAEKAGDARLGKEQPIMVVFLAVPVAHAFHRGETLASATIDGSLGDALIFNNLLNLMEEGRKEAVNRKVDPPRPPNEPDFYAVGTNVVTFDALRRIEASKQLVRVNLVAAKDLSTVEPPKVSFEVEDAAISP